VLASAEFIQTDLVLNLATKCLSCDTVFTFCVQHTFEMTHQFLHVPIRVISYSILHDVSIVDSLGDTPVVLRLINVRVYIGFPS
jgi:hypothetical protein